LWLRPVDRLSATPIAGTEDATFPFWSPRGDAIGFFAGGKLKVVGLTGGPARGIADAPNGQGGTWSVDDVILYAPDPRSPLLSVSAHDGKASRVTKTVVAGGDY